VIVQVCASKRESIRGYVAGKQVAAGDWGIAQRHQTLTSESPRAPRKAGAELSSAAFLPC
jgi:hypothetical protein